jgi:hypothetical protein
MPGGSWGCSEGGKGGRGVIDGVRMERTGGVMRTGPRRAMQAGFVLPVAEREAPAVGSAMGPAALDGLLALQADQTGQIEEREARRHGQALLGGLRRIQLALLTPSGMESEALERLAALCDEAPFTEQAGLRDVLQSISLRVRIELARRGQMAPRPTGVAARAPL